MIKKEPKIYEVICDTHLYGVSPVMNFTSILAKPNAILLGDIIDIKNVKNKEINNALRDKDILLNRFKNRYISGNHELDNFNLTYVIDNILFMHGDYVFWDAKKADEFRKQNYGKGALARIFIKCIDLCNIGPSNITLSKEQEDNLIQIANWHKCNIVVVGHKHPSKNIIIKTVNDITLIVLKRGYNIIEI